MKIKTTRGNAITARRAAASIIRDALGSVFYADEKHANDVEIDEDRWREVVKEMQKILDPIDVRLDKIAKDIDTGHVAVFLAKDPEGMCTYEQVGDTLRYRMHEVKNGKLVQVGDREY